MGKSPMTAGRALKECQVAGKALMVRSVSSVQDNAELLVMRRMARTHGWTFQNKLMGRNGRTRTFQLSVSALRGPVFRRYL